MALSSEQKKILNRIKAVGRQVGASPKEIKAAIETGLVESNLRNLPGGDRDSQGWRQERASLYKDPTNLDASIRRFFSETSAVKGKYGSAGQLAAAVQRPAAQYRGRYQERSVEADKLMGATGPTIPGVSPSAPAATPTGSAPDRQAMLGQYLQQRGRPGALAALGEGLDAVSAPTPGVANAPQPIDPTVTSGAGSQGAFSALSWATTKIGNRETGTNSGGLASTANQSFGMSNQPWCAMFTSLAVTKGGAPSSARTASVAQVLQKAQAGQGYRKGFVNPNQARAGDLIAFGTRHIGMIESVKNGKITMIAGNDSDQVQRRTVTVAGDTKIVRPAYGGRPRR